MIELEIDGQMISIAAGASIIEAADQAGIYIPRFCYHKKLSIAANCRMCLVEVANSGKPLPACATPVTAQMQVFTQSEKALQAQRDVMEYLLINHPLDCPICDQGGECELQDLAMGYGWDKSKYQFGKRAVYDENLGPLIETEMTRCIQCTRCVRFGDEIAGLRELGVMNRGEDERIGTYVKHFMQSELSGNIIDLCPVGALTAKPSRFEVRAWEVREHPNVSPHDCVGSNLYIHSRMQEFAPQRVVYRVVPRENEKINETWISDRDRFSYAALYHNDRIYKPRMKISHQWEEMSWDSALTHLTHHLKERIDHYGVEQIAALASPNSTLEELYLLQKLVRALGSQNIDHRIRQFDFSDQDRMGSYPGMKIAISDIENLSSILLVGSDVRNEQPLFSHHINQATQNGAQVMAVNPQDYATIFKVDAQLTHRNILYPLAEIAKALAAEAQENHHILANIVVSQTAQQMAKQLKSAKKPAIFVGAHAINHPEAAQIRGLLQIISRLVDGSVNWLTEGANSAGAWLAGAIPHRGPARSTLEKTGLSARALLTTQPVKIYFLLNIEPENDCAYSAAALESLKQAELVVCLTTFVTPAMEQYADVILPIAPFTETEGTLVNAAGTWQTFNAVSLPEEESKPAWQVLTILANFLKLEDFNYHTIQQVREELHWQIDQMSSLETTESETSSPILESLSPLREVLVRLAPWPMYRNDPLVRRSKPLQETLKGEFSCVCINQNMADRLELKNNDLVLVGQKPDKILLPLRIDNRLADFTALIYSGMEITAGFGEAMTEVTLEKEQL